MNGPGTLLAIIGVIAGLAALLSVLLWLRKRGVDMDAVVVQSQAAIAKFSSIFEQVRPFIPDGKGTDTVDKIIKAAHIGVENVEQLNKMSKMGPEEKKAAARGYVFDALSVMGVETSPEVTRLVDGAIESEVWEMGRKAIEGRLGGNE